MNYHIRSLSFFLLSALICFKAHALPPEFIGRQALNAPVKIDGKITEYWWISPSTEPDKFLIEREGLVRLSKIILSPDSARDLETITLGSAVVSKKKLNDLGYELSFDESTLTLTFSIPTEVRSKQKMDLAYRILQQDARHFTTPNYSGYLNTYAAQSFTGTKDSYRMSDTNSNFQFVNNFRGLIIDASVDYQDNRSHKWVKDETRFIIDDSEKNLRFTAGDLNHPFTGFQNGRASAGLSLTKDENYKPMTWNRSSEKTSLVLKRPSLVEIYVNGNIVEKKRLQAGPVDISNYPFVSGENDVMIRITDDRGKKEFINLSTLYHQELLAKDQTEFNAALAYPTKFENSIRKYDTKDLQVTGYYRRGFMNELTAGVDFQGGQKRQLLGLEGLWVNWLSFLQLTPALSHEKDGHKGFASRFDARSLDQYDGKRTVFNLRFQHEHHTPGFVLPDGTKTDLSHRFDTYLNYRMKWNLNSGIGLTFNDLRIGKDSTVARASLFRRFKRLWQAGIHFSNEFSGDAEKRVLLTLSWSSEDGRLQNFTNYDSAQKSFNTRFNHHHNSGLDEYKSSINIGRTPTDSLVNVQGEYRNQRAEVTFDHSTQDELHSTQIDHQTRVGFGTALVWSSGIMGISRPVYESFMILHNENNNDDVQVAINDNGETRAGELNKFSPGVVTNLQAYYTHRMQLSTEELEPGTSLPFENFTVFPEFMSGVLVPMAIEKSVSLRGQLYFRGGQPISLATGSLITDKGVEVGRFFTTRSGKFFIEQVKPGKYMIVLDGNIGKSNTLEIKAKNGYINLGKVELEVSDVK